MAAKAAPLGLPKSGAISKGYNFASTWEQVRSAFPNLLLNSFHFPFWFVQFASHCSISLSSKSCFSMLYYAMRSVCSISSLSLSLFLSRGLHFVWISLFSSSANPIYVQNAPLTEQQQAAIATLCHTVAERPFPVDLVRFLICSWIILTCFFFVFSNSSTRTQVVLTVSFYVVFRGEKVHICFFIE